MKNFRAWLLWICVGAGIVVDAIKWGWDPENFRDDAPEGPDTN